MTDETEPAETHVEDGATGRALTPMFTPGGRPGPGRPKGSANRTTLVMREAIAAVFEDLQARHKGPGRYPHFLAWAEANPSDFYRIAERQLPVKIETEGRSIGVVVFRGINDD